MPKKDSDLFQARIKNVKQKIFIDEYIKITQAKVEEELGIGHCSKGLALYRLLQQNAGNNGAMIGGKLIPEYYHQLWIDERLKEFELGNQDYVLQIKLLNDTFSDVMKRENDTNDLEEWKVITNKKKAFQFCFKYFTEKLIPRVSEFNLKLQEGK